MSVIYLWEGQICKEMIYMKKSFILIKKSWIKDTKGLRDQNGLDGRLKSAVLLTDNCLEHFSLQYLLPKDGQRVQVPGINNSGFWGFSQKIMPQVISDGATP